MRILFYTLALAASTICGCSSSHVKPMDISLKTDVRPSATPLVTVDPYFSVWSFSDNLNCSETVHWTGKGSPMIGYVRVDGKTWRVAGKEEPSYDILLNTIAEGPWNAKCLMDKKPAGDWTSAGYDDTSWKMTEGAIGSREMPEVHTLWSGNNRDVWVRREFTLEESIMESDKLILEYSHDDVFELYINGEKVVDTGHKWRNGVRLELSSEAKSLLKAGKNVIAAHCHNTTGGSYVDFGLKRENSNTITAAEAVQKHLSVLPTRSIYTFACGPVDIDLIFTAPLLMDNLELMSRPVNYVTWQVASNDGAEHDVQIYFAGSPKQAVNTPAQAIKAMSGNEAGIDYVCAGTQEQNILGRKGDNVRIDWGYMYVATPQGKGRVALTDYYKALQQFTDKGVLPESESEVTKDRAGNELLALAYSFDFGKVGNKTATDYLMLGYDDIYSIQFFGNNLRPYWNRNGDKTITGEFAESARQYNAIMKKCEKFDKEMMSDAFKSGGKEYAELCALAYRQAISAHKLVESPEAGLLFLSKENFSNGSIGTVDVTYPSAPLFLYYNPELAKGLLNHIFYYSESGKWSKPFAAHDVGTYPLANGQTYGADMPIEESGNMLILAAAIAEVEGNAKYAEKHWNTLTIWTNYLLEHGLDPANQLCTDDFAGHFAHNANLSIKAIEGIASYASLAKKLGKNDIAEKYLASAKKMAEKWKEMAYDGDHYKLTFDKEGTWSQKYNLVWDKILGFNIFDPEIARTEIAWYLTKQNRYGLPLDSRKTYTKTDWIIWTATMTGNMEDFQKFVKPVYLFENETTDRIPMSDWIFTDSTKHVGFQARSVVGGYFIKMLSDKISR